MLGEEKHSGVICNLEFTKPNAIWRLYKFFTYLFIHSFTHLFTYLFIRRSSRSSVNEQHLVGPSMPVCLSRFFLCHNGTGYPVAGTHCCAKMIPRITLV
jgi:hypothetical protein